jgi:5-methylcytosine-specific restriction protein B
LQNYDENKKLENERSEFLSSDFLFQDVMIGHSYFMGDKESLKMKLEYEIKPILREYLKDGILLSDAKEFIDGLKC